MQREIGRGAIDRQPRAGREAGERAISVDVGYFIGGAGSQPSGGTRASSAGMLAEAAYAFVGGRLVTERTARHVRSFDARPAISVGGTEQFALPRLHPGLRDARVWRIVLGIGILCAPQFAVLSFGTVFLHDFGHVGLGLVTATMVFTQIGAMVMRVWSGRWTDRRRNRPAYLRACSLLSAGLFAALAALVLAAGSQTADAWALRTALVVLLLDGRWWVGVLLGLVTVVMATLGDLCESVMKRDLGIKDMSQIIPGHGGLMDRLDSLLATVAPIWLMLHYLVFNS